MILSSIDIGTNTILMLVAEYLSGCPLRIISDTQVIPRIGKGVDKNRRIDSRTLELCIGILSDLRRQAEAQGSERIIATGTSALRDAANRSEFILDVFHNTGIGIQLLSGDEEAVWTYRGVLSGCDNTNSLRAVLDIGGGSTEFTIGRSTNLVSHVSLDLGCVRITERFLLHSPPTESEVNAALSHITAQLASIRRSESELPALYGVAGTVTTLAALHIGLDHFDRDRIAGHSMKREEIEETRRLIRQLTVDEIRSYPVIGEGRADIIFAGILILLAAMEQLGTDRIIVSERGLRYGILLREGEKLSSHQDD